MHHKILVFISMSFTPSKNPSTRPSPTWLWARVAPCCHTCGKPHVGPTRPACETSTAQTLGKLFFLWFLRSFSCFYILHLDQRNLGGSSSLVFESRVAKESEEPSSPSWVFSKEKTSKPEELFSFYFHSLFLRRENFQTWGASSPQAEQVQDQESGHLANDSVWKVNERVYDEDRSSKCTRHRCKSC